MSKCMCKHTCLHVLMKCGITSLKKADRHRARPNEGGRRKKYNDYIPCEESSHGIQFRFPFEAPFSFVSLNFFWYPDARITSLLQVVEMH